MHESFRKILEEYSTQRVFERTTTAWANGDRERTLSSMSEDVVRRVNVDGDRVPFAASVTGKPAMRERLDMMLDMFEFGSYVTESLTISGRLARARIKIIFIHRRTGERLNTSFRMLVTVRSGLITEVQEFHDALYLEAFTRLVERHSA
jgi:ketosteroid isomerase-like protein